MNLRNLAPFLGRIVLLAACGDDTGGGGGAGGSGSGSGGGGGHVEEDVDAEACEHYVEGPFGEHVATDDAATSPDVSAEHTSHTITLVDFAGANGGYVAFQSPAAG